MLPIGEAQLAFPALERGIVQAGFLDDPFTLIAKKMGYRELIDYDKAGVVYPYNTITTLRQTPSKNPDLAERLLKTMIEGIFVSKTEKEKSLTVLKKYMKGTPGRYSGRNLSILEKCYRRSPDTVLGNRQNRPGDSFVPVPASQGDGSEPDHRHFIMKRIEQSGFLKTIYKK
jgi:ABC-type nitrate/sulfonate/bicarbonate transport system substrate-binding protein